MNDAEIKPPDQKPEEPSKITGDIAGLRRVYQPTVACMMLTADRPAMAARAIDAFEAQTYENRMLVILDTGKQALYRPDAELPERVLYFYRTHFQEQAAAGRIGYLRNVVCNSLQTDIVCNWDDDDWSYPRRISDQVRLLDETGADCVGYRSMLFWDTALRPEPHCPDCKLHTTTTDFQPCSKHKPGQAYKWRYGADNYALCTSLCYWRRAWVRCGPFDDVVARAGQQSHYWNWLHKIRLKAVDGIDTVESPHLRVFDPRMIAQVHGGNLVQRAPAVNVAANPHEWSRAPGWDDYCREKMTI